MRKRAFLASYAAAAGFVPAPPVIKYIHGSAPGTAQQELSGTAQTDPKTGTVYYQKPMDKFARGHETGHVLDAEVLNDGDRVYFQRLLHAPAGPWNTGTGTQGGYTSPSEWFADYYAAAATHLDLTKRVVSSYAPIGAVRLKRFEAALGRLGKRNHLKPYQ